MPIRLSRFEMPKGVQRDEATASATYTRFIAEPFEIGYARTIGNSLRRVLLSSIEGAAISSVKIEGVSHEFSSIPGCTEDVTDIILNLKRVLLKTYNREAQTLTLKAKGPCTVTAGDFEEANNVQVLNPRQEICTLDVDGELEMECEVRTGRGFCLADGNKHPDQEIGRIAIDSIFSPVTRCNFLVENTRVGQRTDYEKLVLDIWTDGRIDPETALKTAGAVLRRHLDVFVDYAGEESLEFEDNEKKDADERERLKRLLNMSVNEIELSVRAANCLNNANISTVGELAKKTEADMLKYRNFGKKSLTEIKAKLIQMGLSLGYKFDESLLESKK
ncbi:MAG: DNA-directed RNA polymerase subunit alpha [Kiritimatiellae bacterium]|nr:DNA-directed RNA polymerase subunit alpha [Kiritimatiellia bacterium]MBR4603356.1 DNA-directed RNA polymerase subunit alpha [Kiritimatiellia bacterium]